jgi:drug/metabolite transporter (DMT)-like permease
VKNYDGLRGGAQAAAAMCCVGSLAAVSATLRDYPIFGGQALRYTVAAAILFAADAIMSRLRRPARSVNADAPGAGVGAGASAGPGAGAVRRRHPRGFREWALLTVLATTGLAGFNVCVIAATGYAGPATVGTVIATVPIVLALIVPLLAGRRPRPALVAAAMVVATGAGVTNGLGGGSVPGLLLSLGALAGEVCFSLLAVPLLPALGPVRVSAYSAALAAPMLFATGLIVDGRHVLRMPTAGEAAGLAYLGVFLTTVAFYLWYDALGRLGADRVGLFAGLIPVSAVITTMALGLGRPGGADLIGAALVATGVIAGLGAVGPRSVPAPRPVRPARRPPGHPRSSRSPRPARTLGRP